MFELIERLPIWGQVIAWIVLAVWAFEMFLLPFKFNVRNARLAELIKLQEKTLAIIEEKNKELDRTYVLLSTIMGSLLAKEQESADKKA